MKIILTEKLENLGNIGDIVEIKNGYARNYIIPKRKGIIATKQNIENLKKNADQINIKKKEEIKNLKKINDITILIPVSVKENEETYGSFNYKKLLKIIKNLNINLNTSKLDKNIIIKKTGIYKVTLKDKKLDTEINININLIKINK